MQKEVKTQSHGCEELQQFYEEVLVPLLGDGNLVQQQLVDISGTDALQKVNLQMEMREKLNLSDAKRAGSRLAEVNRALLVDDMRVLSGSHATFEFKPKWLTSSPVLAGLKTTRCRNCAKEAMMAAGTSPAAGGDDKELGHCPLDFVNARDGPEPDAAGSRIVQHFDKHLPTDISRTNFAMWLKSTDLFTRLRDLQMRYDGNGGVLGVQPEDTARLNDLSLAMTLRDVSCFVQVPLRTIAPVTGKLADLDLKDGSRKLATWKKMESDLVEGGYYNEDRTPDPRIKCRLG